jgi:hypothetical protein
MVLEIEDRTIEQQLGHFLERFSRNTVQHAKSRFEANLKKNASSTQKTKSTSDLLFGGPRENCF